MIPSLESFPNHLFRDLNSIAGRMGSILGEGESLNPGFLGFPAVNVGVCEDRVEVFMFAPGLDREKLEVTLQQHHLSISGERALGLGENERVRTNERFDGRFRRVITLPKEVSTEDVRARYRDGVLQVTLARRGPAPKKTIEIQ